MSPLLHLFLRRLPMSLLSLSRVLLSLTAAVCGLLLPMLAAAAIPSTVLVEGGLLSTGGGPAADGDYQVVVSLYTAQSGGQPIWTEGPMGTPIMGGGFTQVLGKYTPLPATVLAKLPETWLEIKVGSDPALQRAKVHSVPYALRAQIAEGLDCSGCIGVGQIDAQVLAPHAKTADLAAYAKAADLGTYAKSADLAAYAKTAALATVATTGAFADLEGAPDLSSYAQTAKLAKVATSGVYSDLSGLPVLVKVGAACGTGLVIKGVKDDGSYDCVKSMDPAALPPDGLDEISNNLLTNQFNEVAASLKAPVNIPDNNPVGVSDPVDVPDFGVAQGLTITADIANSDTASLKVSAIDPGGAKFVLWDKTAKGTAIKTSWPSPTKTVSGDLAAWVGKNPKGKWYLEVIDTGFLNNGMDGKINSWSVSVATLSSKKVRSNGLFQAAGGFQFQVAQEHPVTCDASTFGYAYANDKDKALYICNGTGFFPLALDIPGTQNNPGKNCKDILTKMSGAKDGVYWVNGGTATAVQAYCDMTTNGGGWTLAARIVGNSYCHIDPNAAGTLTAPNQAGCAKLSDALIRGLYSDQFWLSCGTSTPSRWGKIDAIAKFNTNSSTGDKNMTWSETYGGATYSGTDDACCNFGDHNYHSPHIIYSIAKGYNGGNYTTSWPGCYNNLQGWGQSGFLYVR
jgi:subtilisin-like proprotein convertase family protein